MYCTQLGRVEITRVVKVVVLRRISNLPKLFSTAPVLEAEKYREDFVTEAQFPWRP